MYRTLHHAGLPVQASSRPVFVVLVIAAQSRPGTAGAHLVLPPLCFPVLLPGIADTRHGLARPTAAVLDNSASLRDGGVDRRHCRYLTERIRGSSLQRGARDGLRQRDRGRIRSTKPWFVC